MMDLNEYYKYSSNNFDRTRLDGYSEVDEHCSWFLQGFEPIPHRTLLDIGCGTGRYTHAFANNGLLAVGIDRSPDQIAIANTRIPSMLMDALSLDFPKESFDVVSMIMMIHQIKENDLPSLFHNITCVLCDAGKVWIKTCSHLDLERRPFNDLLPSALNINSARYPSIEELMSVASTFGLSCSRQLNIVNLFTLSGKDLLERFQTKHNSTLHLIPEQEYLEAIALVEEQYAYGASYTFQHYHTLVELIKS